MLISRQSVIPAVILPKEKMNEDKKKKVVNLSVDVWCSLTILKTIYLKPYVTVMSV
jgi:hypothetical protein